MDEQSRTGDELVIDFLLSVSTKPSLVKFNVGGFATVKGGQKAFEAALEVNPESEVPMILQYIYQHVFTSLFLLSTLIDMPYPPPDLIHSPPQTQGLQIEEQEGTTGTRAEDLVAAEAVDQVAQQNTQQ